MVEDNSHQYLVPYEHGAASVEKTDEGLLVHGFVEKVGKGRQPTRFSRDLEADVVRTLWENDLEGNVSFHGSDRTYVRMDDGTAELVEPEYTADTEPDDEPPLTESEVIELSDEDAIRYWERGCEGKDGQEEI
jgi:hypothetical protein